MFDELRAIQASFGYLPTDQLHQLSGKLKIPVSQIHAVASFYPHFYLSPRPKWTCASAPTCPVICGAPTQVRKSLDQAFAGQGQDAITIRDVSCLGRCDTAPALSINDHIYSGGSPIRYSTWCAPPRKASPCRARIMSIHHRQRLTTDPYNGASTYKAVRRFVEGRDFKAVLEMLKASGLRGMGGAGFPTGTKWEIVRNAAGTQKYIVCNADESEPGTIKDRFIMENLPHLVIEGMIVAGLVTGATKGIIYIRHEYEEPREALQEEIQRCYRERVLGSSVMGSDLVFDLEIFVSPGGYICGEESALLEALEGKRAEPRNKPPFPGTNGLWNCPHRHQQC